VRPAVLSGCARLVVFVDRALQAAMKSRCVPLRMVFVDLNFAKMTCTFELCK
jgi:hypothetical protein